MKVVKLVAAEKKVPIIEINETWWYFPEVSDYQVCGARHKTTNFSTEHSYKVMRFLIENSMIEITFAFQGK